MNTRVKFESALSRQVGQFSVGIDGYRYLRALLVELPKAKTAEDFEALPWRLAPAER